eukprot:TRINITY_DN25008_c0_g1_i1.p3 TRINITY_DN25008_c0_g1~~TRINITY_DN25008_c0_g1_i1.p3  ORF type:complete len:115 (-),score=4.34 TRINITY_DN25008_c0_g1_i1:175-519(-)
MGCGRLNYTLNDRQNGQCRGRIYVIFLFNVGTTVQTYRQQYFFIIKLSGGNLGNADQSFDRVTWSVCFLIYLKGLCLGNTKDVFDVFVDIGLMGHIMGGRILLWNQMLNNYILV